MKNSRGLVLSLCLLPMLTAFPLVAQDYVYDASGKLVFGSFLMLESPYEKGGNKSITRDTTQVKIYSGGALPTKQSIDARMYTFKARFSFGAAYDGSDISLSMGLTEYPYALFLNGVELFKQGRNTAARYNSSIRKAFAVFLPPSLLRADSPNELVLQIYPRTETSALDELYIDRTEKVSSAVFWRNFIGINLIQGAFVLSLIIGIYFIILFFAEKKRQRNHLIFALFCFAFFFATIAIATFHDTGNEILMENFSKFGLLMSSTLILRFFMEFTGVLNKSTLLKFAIYITGCAAALGALFQTDKVGLTAWFSVSITVLVLPQIILSLAVLAVAVFSRRQKRAIVLIAAFGIMIAAVLRDMNVLRSDTPPYAWLTTYGYFAIVLAIFALLAQEQAALYHASLQNEADLIVDRSRIERLNLELTEQKDSFYRFVPTEFLHLLGRDSAVDIKLGDSSLRQLTILFSDIRKFTAIAEGMKPMEIFEFLNKYLLRMERAVKSNAGFVDKYIGDGVMALYAAESPIAGSTSSSSADNSLKSALCIKRELFEFNEEIAKSGMQPVRIGVGINSGEVTLGTVGSHNRLDTTVIGDAVNLASRLESLTKYYGTQNLVSHYTVDSLNAPGDFKLRLIDRVSVPGRTTPVKIYELLEPGLPADALKSESAEELGKAIALYLSTEFEKAKESFSRLAKHNPNDPIPSIYMERCANYLKHKPLEDWNGVFAIPNKETLGS